jgi:hypothetical protein
MHGIDRLATVGLVRSCRTALMRQPKQQVRLETAISFICFKAWTWIDMNLVVWWIMNVVGVLVRVRTI